MPAYYRRCIFFRILNICKKATVWQNILYLTFPRTGNIAATATLIFAVANHVAISTHRDSGDSMMIPWRPMAKMASLALLAKMVPMDHLWWQGFLNCDPLAQMVSLATVVPMDRLWCHWCQ